MRRGRPRHDDILTPREWQVVELLRDGLTNEEIADRLGISFGGAKYHVAEILSKLGVNSREEAITHLDSRADHRFIIPWLLPLFRPEDGRRFPASLLSLGTAAVIVSSLTVIAYLAGWLDLGDDNEANTAPAPASVIAEDASATTEGLAVRIVELIFTTTEERTLIFYEVLGRESSGNVARLVNPVQLVDSTGMVYPLLGATADTDRDGVLEFPAIAQRAGSLHLNFGGISLSNSESNPASGVTFKGDWRSTYEWDGVKRLPVATPAR